MERTTRLFHLVSYLQYPFHLWGLYHIVKVYIVLFGGFDGNLEPMLPDIQNSLIFIGIGMSFSTLQDTKKTQNNISKKIWQSPTKGKIFIFSLAASNLFMFVLGISGLYVSQDNALSEVSLGLIVFAIGILGVLKAAMEMFENHRLDKNG